ncbi:MAG: DUF1453 family protein [Alphaproteobacteria bacterium]|nr:DUF1453 family protein [Alphaproteobacteria bacterium]MBV9693935.1 DUF1453 family protein [Alphaproteobacteria bacterium]
MPKDYLPYLAPLLIVAVIALRMTRFSKPVKVRPGRLWIGPVYILAAMLFLLLNPMLGNPLASPYAIPLYAAAIVVGIGVGYLRARHQEFSIDPETGDVMSKASPVGLILVLAIFVLRFGLRTWMGGASPDPSRPIPPQLVLSTDAMLFFAFGMVTASAWEVWRRTRPLVLAHRAGQGPK